MVEDSSPSKHFFFFRFRDLYITNSIAFKKLIAINKITNFKSLKNNSIYLCFGIINALKFKSINF
jgi:hypothetical protein